MVKLRNKKIKKCTFHNLTIQLTIFEAKIEKNFFCMIPSLKILSAWVERSLLIYSDLSMALSERNLEVQSWPLQIISFSPKHLYKIISLSIVLTTKDFKLAVCFHPAVEAPYTYQTTSQSADCDEGTSCRIQELQ